MQNDLRQKTRELSNLTLMLKKTEDGQDEQMRLRKAVEKDLGKRVAQLKTQLIGAIRRINYLVEEKKGLLEDSVKRSRYISTLELELVRNTDKVKELTKRLQHLKMSEGTGEFSPAKKQQSEHQSTPRHFTGEDPAALKSLRDYVKTVKCANMESLKKVEQEIRDVQSELKRTDQIPEGPNSGETKRTETSS